jgi:hypothetical protein
MSAGSRAVPTPTELLDAPEQAMELPRPEAVRLLARVGALEAVLRRNVAGVDGLQNTPELLPGGLWTVAQVAAYLRLKPSTVRTYCEGGILPHVSIPAGLRFRRGDIEVWVERRFIRDRPRRNRPSTRRESPLTATPRNNDSVDVHATAPEVSES